MSTIKFTIEKTEIREVEFEAPCYRKSPAKNKVFKIVSEEEIYELYIDGENKFHVHQWSILWTDAKESEPATEQEWNAAMKQLADHFGQFMCNQGLTEQGYPLPEPEEETINK